jgi:hypothetical protein
VQLDDLPRHRPVERLAIDQLHLDQRLAEQSPLSALGHLALASKGGLELSHRQQALLDHVLTDAGDDRFRGCREGSRLGYPLQVGTLRQQGDQRQIDTAVWAGAGVPGKGRGTLRAWHSGAGRRRLDRIRHGARLG